MGVVIENSWEVARLLSDPLLLAGLEVALELSVVFADDSFCWVIKAISDVVGSLRNCFRSVDIVTNKGLTIRPETLELFSVESSVLNGAVVPFSVLELKIVIEEVLSFD